MTVRRAYLDYNASAPLLPAARAAMLAALDLNANPSSVHMDGRAARKAVDDARRAVAALVNAKPEHVVFTSGATEGATTLLSPDWMMGRAPVRMSKLVVCATDHPCILGGGRFSKDAVDVVGVDRNGVVDLVALEAVLKAHDRDGLVMVALHAANNETGVTQPIAEVARLVQEYGGVLVVDAVQVAGRIPIDITDGYGDFLILSSHKIGGPMGVGAIVGTSDLMMPAPLIRGGGQEKGHRAGTENLPGIAGFGAAAREAHAGLGDMPGLADIRDRLERSMLAMAPDAMIFGQSVERLCNTSFFAVPGLKAETAQIAFDLAGVSLSAGSACSSGKVGPSHVLKAMGVADEAGALRVSIGRDTGEDDIAAFERALRAHLARRAVGSEAA